GERLLHRPDHPRDHAYRRDPSTSKERQPGRRVRRQRCLHLHHPPRRGQGAVPVHHHPRRRLPGDLCAGPAVRAL
ncbi:MAG: hypothetical protein AVDCRST_MAG77-2124, partial [uncultured Chloroflexi bacterium]